MFFMLLLHEYCNTPGPFRICFLHTKYYERTQLLPPGAADLRFVSPCIIVQFK